MNLAKAYTPDQYEPTIYAQWETSGAFGPTGEGEPYGVIMPPPNANGNLHIGHALDMNLKDILVRFHRMKGKDAIFIPGADHAGFETWVVYEKVLDKEGKSRFDFSREQLYSQIWNFVEARRGDMELQLRALGVSADWEHSVYTLDEKVIKTVYETFRKLWEDDLVYRGERIVNFCTKHRTSFADIEVVHKNEKGKLWKIAYPTLDKIDEIIIATSRPETLFGDVAVAVHPEDERYKHLIGSTVLLPLSEREIPIIADEYVDSTFGTGALKVTPAHDPNDYEIGKRHDLPHIQVIDFDGTMKNVPSQFAGLPIEDARKRVLGALQASELLRGEETIEHAVGHCYKCDTVIEPMLKDQWFLKMKPLADRAKEVLLTDEISFYPASRKRVLIQYLDGLRDWNLSRQIPWGIPIPAFQNIQDENDWLFNTQVDQETITVDGKTYKREEDTFDTWFSSGQWPFVTTDALDAASELSRFYPSAVMETGTDLLDRWVARMIMLGLYRTDKVPFKDVYLHGMVNDEHNQKMSKSKGNVINPMDKVAQYGSDALRLGIIANRSPAQHQAFSEGSLIAGRNFCNKLWNVARFIEGKLGENYKPMAPTADTLADHWIVRELTATTQKVSDLLENYRFAEASEAIYHSLWSNVADWYIEASKDNPNNDLLVWVLDTTLRITHPFAPFVTETIWQTLPWYNDLLIKARWPQVLTYNEIAAAEFERLQQLITEARFVQNELPGKGKHTLVYGSDSLVADNAALIKRMAQLHDVTATDQPRGLRLANSGREAWLDIDAKTLEEHESNLEVRLAEAHVTVKRLTSRLDTPSYVEKAPAHLVDQTKSDLREAEALVARLQAELEVIGS
ncbi:MAG TPA: valine--tRNA ligase [Candidatus Saccharimonadales bacterium]